MAGEEICRAKLWCRISINTNSFHELQRFADFISYIFETFRLLTFNKVQHPAVNMLKVGIPALRKRTKKIQCCRRLAIGHHQTLRVRHARCFVEINIVDDVAAIAWQFNTVDRFCWSRAWFCKLARNTANFNNWFACAISQHNRHLQEHAEEIAHIVRVVFSKGFSTIAALKQKRLTASNLAQSLF